MLARGPGHGLVGGDEGGTETFSEGYVGGVVRGELVAQLEHARHQPMVEMAAEWQAEVVTSCHGCFELAQLATEEYAPKGTRGLAVAERGHREAAPALSQKWRVRPAPRG